MAFKVVCISDMSSTFMKCGEIYDAVNYPKQDPTLHCGFFKVSTQGGKQGYQYKKQYFLRLPTEPKSCADMTMEEYLAMVCLRAVAPFNVEWFDGTVNNKNWKPCIQISMSHKTHPTTLYRIKPEKSAKEIEIERIEGAMHKLAEDLAKLKES